MGYFYDASYILVLIGALLCFAASASVKSTYRRYLKERAASGLTGAQTAARILENNGIRDVQIRQVAGELSDHYDPARKIVNLSPEVFNGDSIAAISIAAHECGHVVQHETGYTPLNIRTALVPAANIGSNVGLPMIVVGIFLENLMRGGGLGLLLAEVGVFAFALAVLFQFVTLPVEFDASNRALQMLGDYGILGADEGQKAHKVLKAAAMTYVAATASSVLQLIRLLLIVRGNSRRRD